MSFSGTARIGIRVQGLAEIQAALAAMQREWPQVKMNVHRDATTFFVAKAKGHVHVISGDLGRSIKVDSITPQEGIVSANTPYARREEERKGNRKIAPGTPHAYMKPAAAETSIQMPTFIRKRIDELLNRHKTR